jgi:hypothetical protein
MPLAGLNRGINGAFVCGEFLERVHSNVCHLCLQPEGLHPTADDRTYWAAWLLSELELEWSLPSIEFNDAPQEETQAETG